MVEPSEQNSGPSQRRLLLLRRLTEQRAGAVREQEIPRRAIAESCPVSYPQELMWLLDQLNPDGSTAYNSVWTGRLAGPLNLAALRDALNAIIERHEVLRTVYAVRDGVPQQIVTQNRLTELQVIDLTHVPEAEREGEAERALCAAVRRPFDLTSDLMLRAMLLRMDERDHFLLLDMHHIAIDGWSKEILYRELGAYYNAFSSGKSLSLPELEIQYADFALWQRERLEGGLFEKQLSYWKQRLLGAPPLLELPTDHPRPPALTFRGGHERMTFPVALLHKLKALNRSEGVTLFMTVMAAFQVLLYRYTGREDMVVATVVAGRPRPELENLIGYFSNSLVLRTDLTGDPTFSELLRRVRDGALEAYDNQDLPFHKLVVELKPQRDLSYAPLYQVMLNLQNQEREEINLAGLTVQDVKIERGSAKFDLTLSIGEKADGLRVAFEYSTDLFESQTVRRMLGHLQTVLESVAENPEQSISSLPLLTAPETHQLLVEWNDTKKEYRKDVCIHELFESQVERTPEAVALVFGEQQLSYRELNARANCLANFLLKNGVGPGVPVAICLERSLEMAIGVLGILKAGGAYLPVAAEYAKERLHTILGDSGAALLLTQSGLQLAGALPALLKVIYLDSDWESICAGGTDNPEAQTEPEALAYLVYTSGSTGKPKGVMVEHRSLVNAYQAWEEAYQLRSAVRSHLQMANFSFDVFTGDLLRALCSGGKLVLCPLEVLLEPAQLYALMVREKIDCAEFVPSVLRSLLEHLVETGQSLEFMRLLMTGSDSWYVEEYLAVASLCGSKTRVINSYGVAEATIDSAFFEGFGRALSSGALAPIGRPFGNTRLYILDRHMQLVPIGVPGELCIAGEGVARGYLNQSQLTAEKFVADVFSRSPAKRMYKTGDQARYLPDGNIEFLGRLDQQVKIRGFRVELGEIEVVLSEHPGVREVVVVARGDAAREKKLVAYVVTNQHQVPSQDELRRYLKEKLPAYMVPSSFLLLEALPLTANGKIDRKVLPAPQERVQVAEIRLNNVLHYALVTIWEDLLGISPIGVRDDFFELGGHSLLAARLVAEISRTFGKPFSLTELFKGPTVEHIARVLVEGMDQQTSPLVPVQPQGSKTPFFFLHGDLHGGGYYTRKLARRFSVDQPFYALHPHGTNGRELSDSIEAMAADYVSVIKEIQPEGPYLLGGFCSGGIVAFEMARQLQARNESVSRLILIDTLGVNAALARVADRVDRFLRAMYVQTLARRRVRGYIGQSAWLLRRSRKYLQRLRASAQSRTPKLMRLVGKTYQVVAERTEPDLVSKWRRVTHNYIPGRYDGRITVFLARPDGTLDINNTRVGWQWVADVVDVHAIPGAHLTSITRHIDETALRVSAALVEDESRTLKVS